MKKIKSFLKILIGVLSAFFPVSVIYAACDSQSGTDWISCVPQKTVPELLTIVIQAILALTGTVAVLFLILGGFQYITSAGNPDNIGKAKNTILYAVIGIIVVLLSYAIIHFIIGPFI